MWDKVLHSHGLQVRGNWEMSGPFALRCRKCRLHQWVRAVPSSGVERPLGRTIQSRSVTRASFGDFRETFSPSVPASVISIDSLLVVVLVVVLVVC